MSPNNSNSANLVTPPGSSVKVNTEHDCSIGIATGLIIILKEVDIIISANEQYLTDLDGMKKPSKVKVKRSVNKLRKSNIDALSVIKNKINNALCLTGLAHKAKRVNDRNVAKDNHAAEQDKYIFDTEGYVVEYESLSDKVAAIIRSAAPIIPTVHKRSIVEETQVPIPRTGIKIKVNKPTRKSQRTQQAGNGYA